MWAIRLRHFNLNKLHLAREIGPAAVPELFLISKITSHLIAGRETFSEKKYFNVYTASRDMYN